MAREGTGDGNDLLNGGLGAGDLFGRRGNDIYALDQAGDVITEMANQGLDTIRTATLFVDLALYPNIENASLTGARGEIRCDVAGPDLFVQGTITGAAPTFENGLAGIGALAAGDVTF